LGRVRKELRQAGATERHSTTDHLEVVGPQPAISRGDAFNRKLPPGRARLVTKPSLTGSSPVMKTMGIVGVAPLAATTAGGPPTVANTATCRRTNSAANAGSRSIMFSAERYSITTFSPST